MKSLHLFIALLFTIFAFQAQSLRLTKTQESLSSQSGTTNFAQRLGFKELLKTAYEAKDSTQAISNVFRYYVDGTTYFNYIQSLFCKANTSGGEFITLDQFFSITDIQGIHRTDARRVSEYVRGVFGAAGSDDEDEIQIDAFSFNQAADLLFAEAVSFITFSYITRGAQPTRHVTVSKDQVLDALVRIFNLFKDTYPLPDCDELGYLFIQCDEDKDGELNLQEFHVFLSIYLRYYKYGIQSNRYAAVVMKDKVFDYVFENQESLGGRSDRIDFLQIAFKRFLQIAISDASINQMSHLFFTKFDSDASGAIDPNEFAALLSFFHAPLDEVDVLFYAADTDASGQIDFSEFVVTLTTLLRKLTADFAYNLLRSTGNSANREDTYSLFHNVETEEGLKLISPSKFREIWDSVNSNEDVYTQEEFAIVISEVIAYIRTMSRLSEDAQITAVAGIDVDNTNVEEILAIKDDASQQVNDFIYGLGEDLGYSSDLSDYEVPVENDDIIEQIEDETGYTIDDINEVVEDQFNGVTIEDVIQTITTTTTEEVIDAVATIAVEEIGHTDCPTEEAIQVAVEAAIESGIVDDYIEQVESLSSEEVLTSVEETVEAEQVTTEAAQVIDLSGDVDTDAIIEAVADNTGAEISTEDIVSVITETTGAETVEEVLEVIENSSTEAIIEAVTDSITATVTITSDASDSQESDSESESDSEASDDEITEQIAEETGYTGDELNEIIEDQIGDASVTDVIEAVESVATEQVIEAVTAAVIDEVVDSSDCPTEDAIVDAIESVIENGGVDEIIEQIQDASDSDVIETVEAALDELSDSESSDLSDNSAEITETVADETGYTEEEITEIVEEQTGGSVSDVIDAVETVATEQVIEAVTEAVVEQVAYEDCPTEGAIVAAVEDAIYGGVIDDVVESIQEADPVDIIETVEEVIAETSDSESDYESSEDYSDAIVEITETVADQTGYTEDEISEIVEEQTGGSVEDVIEAVSTVATEQVIEAVAEAVLEDASYDECTTEEAIIDAIEDAIDGGVVDDVVASIQEAAPEDVLETVEAAIAEGSDESSDEDDFESSYLQLSSHKSNLKRNLLRRKH